MTILHTNGFHILTVAFCGCSSIASSLFHRNQLLRVRLFPASSEKPATAFSFAVLDLYIQEATQGKLSVYDFYLAMMQITDNAEIEEWKVSCSRSFHKIANKFYVQKRYDELSHAIRWYRHLVLLKRFGRAHDPLGIEKTRQGSLALRCPACPLPEVNLPPDWRDAPEKSEYVLIAYDSN